MERFDKNGDGKINLSEFLEWKSSQLGVAPSPKQQSAERIPTNDAASKERERLLRTAFSKCVELFAVVEHQRA